MAHLDKILADKQHYVHVLLDRVYNPNKLPPYEALTSWHLENALEALSPRIDALKPTEFEVDKSRLLV